MCCHIFVNVYIVLHMFDCFFLCCDFWHILGQIFKYLLYPKWPYPVHVQLLVALCRVCLQDSPGSLLIYPNYWIWRMCILACSWTMTLRSGTTYLPRIFLSVHLLSFAPRPLPSKIFKQIIVVVIINGKKFHNKPFLTLQVEHRNSRNDINSLWHKREQNFDKTLLIVMIFLNINLIMWRSCLTPRLHMFQGIFNVNLDLFNDLEMYITLQCTFNCWYRLYCFLYI